MADGSQRQNLVGDLGLELSHTPADWHDRIEWMSPDKRTILVGYLVHDGYCDDPLTSCDAMGKIKNKHDGCMDVLGRYSDGTPNYERFTEIVGRLRGNDNYTDTDNILALEMWLEAASRGKVGTQYAVPLREKYRSGYEEMTDHNRTPEAAWVPDKALLDHLDDFPEGEKRDAEAHRCFEQALEEYNKWAEGDCYGVVIDEFELVGDDEPEYEIVANLDSDGHACWGYVGSEYALEELKSEMAGLTTCKKPARIIEKNIANH